MNTNIMKYDQILTTTNYICTPASCRHYTHTASVREQQSVTFNVRVQYICCNDGVWRRCVTIKVKHKQTQTHQIPRGHTLNKHDSSPLALEDPGMSAAQRPLTLVYVQSSVC